MSIVGEKENVFKFFQILPPEIRMEAINSMQPDDRCRFRRCSQQSDREARASKQFMFSLRISGWDYNDILIEVMYGDFYIYKRHFGFKLKIIETSGRKFMKCVKPNDDEMWTIEIDQSTDLPQFAIEYFKGLLKPYERTIKKLTIDGELFSNDYENTDFGIESLNNLEEVNVNSGIISQILPNTKRPLKWLYSRNEKNETLFTGFEETYKVQGDLWFGRTKFNNDQFVRLSAETVQINIGELTVKDVFNFIKSWQSGNVRKNFKFCIWDLEGSNFDSRQLFKLFGIDLDQENKKVEIKQYEENGKTAELSPPTNDYNRIRLFVK